MIRQSPTLSATEKVALFGAEPDPFGVAHLGLEWRAKEDHFVLEVDGEAVSHVGLLRHDIQAEVSSVCLAGLGAVITAGKARGRGHATSLIQHVIGHVREAWRADAALLFCLPGLVPFYQRHGFQLVPAPVIIEQSAGPIPAPLPVMARSLNENQIWHRSPVTLGSPPW